MLDLPGNVGGLIESVRRVIDTIASMLKNRVELAKVEANEEKMRLASAAIWGGIFLFASFMAFISSAVTLFFLFWEQRLFVAAGLFVFCLIGALTVLFILKRRLKLPGPVAETIIHLNLFMLGGVAAFLCLRGPSNAKGAFSETIAQIKKDRAWLRKKK